jgi:hypothetical protein
MVRLKHLYAKPGHLAESAPSVAEVVGAKP